MKIHIWTMIFGSFVILSVSSAGRLYKQFTVEATTVLQQANKTPVCLDRSVIPEEELHWLYIPTDPSELATSEYYGYLSGQLIQAGVVDASACPLNGLWTNGYANACGLEKTRELSLYLQNVYDDEILAVGQGVGVPPVMIKQQIRYESQFWPTQMGYHYGLGHLTYPGAITALTWSRALYEDTYAHSLPDPSADLPSELLSMMNAACPTCALKIDVPKAEQSITYIGEALLGFCRQTSQVVFNATNKNAGDVVDYATIWQLTLLNYNVGPNCVYNAVKASYKNNDEEIMNWDEIAATIDENESCSRGVPYVDNITGEYYNFGTTP
jgi:hypothetical protein